MISKHFRKIAINYPRQGRVHSSDGGSKQGRRYWRHILLVQWLNPYPWSLKSRQRQWRQDVPVEGTRRPGEKTDVKFNKYIFVGRNGFVKVLVREDHHVSVVLGDDETKEERNYDNTQKELLHVLYSVWTTQRMVRGLATESSFF